MLLGLEFIASVAAIACGIAMFVLALRRRPARGVVLDGDSGTIGIMKSNIFSLTIIALLFFGSAFLIDVFS